MAESAKSHGPRRYGGWIFIVIVIITMIVWVSRLRENRYPAAHNIAVLPLKGLITTSRSWIDQLNEFIDDDRVAALIIDIDSPGGAVTPAYEMYTALRSARDSSSKPIVVSMGSLAASGGYMVALGGDTIIANPTSITGSIGVIMNFPDFTDLMNKVGVQMNVVKTGPYKDSGSPYRHLGEQDSRYYQGVIEDVFAQFKEIVQQERQMTATAVDDLADGRVYTGRQALANGLVDGLGTLADAKDIACGLAELPHTTPLVYPPKKKRSFFRVILDDAQSAVPDWSNWTAGSVQYRMP